MKRLLQLAAILLLTSKFCWSAVTLKNQGDAYTYSSGSSLACSTFSNALTNPSVIVVITFAGSGATITAPSDTAGNTYSDVGAGQITMTGLSSRVARMYIAYNTHTTASNVVTVHTSASTSYMACGAGEFTGLKASSDVDTYNYDTDSTSGTAGSNSIVQASSTTHADGELIVSCLEALNGDYTPGTSPISFTAMDPTNLDCEYGIETSRGSTAPTWGDDYSADTFAGIWAALMPLTSNDSATMSEKNTASDTSLGRTLAAQRGDSEANTASDSLAAVHGTSNHYSATPSETNTASDALARLAAFARGESETNTASASLTSAVNNWDFIQEATNDGCTLSSTTCTMAWNQPTTAGSFIMLAMGEKGYTGTPTIASAWMCTANPCTSDSSGGTWVGGLSGSPWTITGASPNHSVDLAYELTNSGGLTYITVTRTNTGAVSSFWGLTAIEVKLMTGGSVSLDGIGNPNGGSASCTSCTGSSFSGLIGAHDALLQEGDIDNAPSAPSSPYFFNTNGQWLMALGYSTTSAPTFTQSPAGQAILPALAFKAGNATYTGTLSETNTASDSLGRTVGFNRGDAETNTASDTSLVRTLAAQRGDSETSTASDALARLAGFSRADSETNTASASLTGSHGMYPAITETHTASDSLGRAAGFNRTDSETNTASDALARLGNFGRGDSETNTASDLLSAHKPAGNIYYAVMNEALSLSDALSRLSAYLRRGSETNTTSDALGRLAASYRQAAETASFSDVVAGIWMRSLGIPMQPRHAGTVPAKTKTGEAPAH